MKLGAENNITCQSLQVSAEVTRAEHRLPHQRYVPVKHKDENLCLLKLKIECNITLNSKSFSIVQMKIEYQFSIRMSK